MSYKHTEMPPVIRRTDESTYRLEGQSGALVAEFDQTQMDHPGGWWSAMIDAMASSYDTDLDAIHDLTLLTVKQDWEYIDETQ